MNFLAHLYLSRDDPELLVGNLMGDFVKGRLENRFPPGIEKGIILHRQIDSFASRNAHFLSSKRRIDIRFGHYRGVLVDLYYDHFLAANWESYSQVPFHEFIRQSHRTLEKHRSELPERLQNLLAMIFVDWLPSYGEITGIEAVLQRMGKRIQRPNPLGAGASELKREYGAFLSDFQAFLPEIREFCNTLSI